MPVNLKVLHEILNEVPRDFDKVYVYPNGEVYEEMPSNTSDDFEVRYAGHCDKCDSRVTPHYGEPLASCNCHTGEWYF